MVWKIRQVEGDSTGPGGGLLTGLTTEQPPAVFPGRGLTEPDRLCSGLTADSTLATASLKLASQYAHLRVGQGT